MARNIMLIGLGPHARYHHYHIIKELEIQGFDCKIKCIVDLVSQKDSIRRFLYQNNDTSVEMIFVPDEDRNLNRVEYNTSNFLKVAVKKHSISHVLICTEPKAHEAYIWWAIENNLSFMTDKPVFVSTYEDVRKAGQSLIEQKYISACSALPDDMDACVMLPRRTHPVIQYVVDYLNTFIKEYKIPITHITLCHNEGMWNMPDEYFTRENHPYKYGYGALFHTGYHFIDLVCWILKLNRILPVYEPDTIEIAASIQRPFDIMHQVNSVIYEKYFNKKYYFSKEDLLSLGETDIQLLMNFKYNDAVCSSAVIDLLQTGFSNRNSSVLPEDTYRKNGRTYQEFISIELSYFLTVKIMRMTTSPRNGTAENELKDFIVYIFRNTDLVYGKPVEKKIFKYKIIDFENNSTNLGDVARLNTIKDWLYEGNTKNSFQSHYKPMILFANVHTLLSEMHNKNLTMAQKTFVL